MRAHILVADDDPGVLAGIDRICRAAGYRVSGAPDGVEALRLARELQPDLVLLDIHMPEAGGLEVLPRLCELHPPPGVVVMTGLADVSTAVQAMREGAADFLEKPIRRAVLEACLSRVLSGRALRAERDRLRDEIRQLRSGPMVGRSPGMRVVLEKIQRVAGTPRTTVLVRGETGTGKELVARAVHEHSSRSRGPFVALNCAALTEPLIEAELFGYEKGAFTGAAHGGREGLLAAAAGGTLFLDEIAELAPALQAKLLRVLQERTYRRVGGAEDRAMDARVVASTHRDLEERVREGRFREDLYYRLNVLTIAVPPLRGRREDVPLLASHFLRGFAAEFGRAFQGFTPAAVERLLAHPWPGNVRELRNAVERAALLAGGGEISPEHLSLSSGAEPTPPASGTPSEEGSAPQPQPVELSLAAVEEAHVRRVLDACSGNRSRAARILGINRTTLYNKLRRYGIDG